LFVTKVYCPPPSHQLPILLTTQSEEVCMFGGVSGVPVKENRP
jgi:hypothetical protein